MFNKMMKVDKEFTPVTSGIEYVTIASNNMCEKPMEIVTPFEMTYNFYKSLPEGVFNEAPMKASATYKTLNTSFSEMVHFVISNTMQMYCENVRSVFADKRRDYRELYSAVMETCSGYLSCLNNIEYYMTFIYITGETDIIEAIALSVFNTTVEVIRGDGTRIIKESEYEVLTTISAFLRTCLIYNFDNIRKQIDTFYLPMFEKIAPSFNKLREEIGHEDCAYEGCGCSNY